MRVRLVHEHTNRIASSNIDCVCGLNWRHIGLNAGDGRQDARSLGNQWSAPTDHHWLLVALTFYWRNRRVTRALQALGPRCNALARQSALRPTFWRLVCANIRLHWQAASACNWRRPISCVEVAWAEAHAKGNESDQTIDCLTGGLLQSIPSWRRLKH